MMLAIQMSVASMVDGGANIYITSILSLLVDVVDIALMPISVAVEGNARLWMIAALNMAYIHSKWKMGVSTTKHATSVQTLSKLSSPLRL
jgi:hypothetical protein